MLQNDNNNSKLIFIHANGFPPNAYESLFKNINKIYSTENYLLRPLWDSREQPSDLKNWNLFQKDFTSYLESKNKDRIIGLGHSVGGNIILRTALSKPSLFKKIILLDPTLFVPKIIYLWKLALFFKAQEKFHPWISATLNRKMNYDNYDAIFDSYRKKNVFSKIDDANLKIYIESITKLHQNKLHITYEKDWEYQIYKTGLLSDMYIWKNIKNLKLPCLIIRAESSNAFLDSSQKKIEQLNPNIQFETLKDTTHLFPLEKPSKTYQLIKKFL